jgi:hypothetical protein
VGEGGLIHAALKAIYIGGKLPFLSYGAPVWKRAIDKVTYKSKLIRVQRLINFRSAKAYCTVSNKSLCILIRLNPNDIKVEETFQFYHFNKGSTKEEALFDRDMEVMYWHHPTETINFLTEYNEETSTIQIFTDGSNSEQGVGTGIAIIKSSTYIKSLKYKLNKRYTNN